MGRLVSVGGLVALGLVGCPACRWFARNPSTAGELRIGADHAPPYYSHLPGGRVEGLTVDVMNAAAARAGIQLRWVPWTGLIDDAFNSHAVDLWPGVSPNARRRQFAQFTEPWLTNGFVLVSLKDSPPRVAAGWNGEKIAIRDGPFLESAARSRFPSSPLYRASSREGALQAVCRGEAAAALTELRFLDVAILDRPAGCETTRLRLQPLAGLTSRLSIMSTPAAAPAAQRIREQIDRLAADGTFADILEHWSAFSSVDAHSIEELKGAETRNRIYAGALLAGLLTLAAVVFLYLRANAANRRAGEARAIAETASAAKTDFLAKMSHEIRTP
ncbi:MAG TPA: hypothetical protein DEH78_30040, partial [Solibacterales bacterium]|nr:hypothetical protein [Bryobacterales bacterium]